MRLGTTTIEYEDRSPEVYAAVYSEVYRGMNLLAQEVAQDAAAAAPSDTGKLKSSIKAIAITANKQPRPLSASRKAPVTMAHVITDTGDAPDDHKGYGGWVEIGTRDTPRQPFIRPAVSKNKRKLNRLIRML